MAEDEDNLDVDSEERLDSDEINSNEDAFERGFEESYEEDDEKKAPPDESQEE